MQHDYAYEYLKRDFAISNTNENKMRNTRVRTHSYNSFKHISFFFLFLSTEMTSRISSPVLHTLPFISRLL